MIHRLRVELLGGEPPIWRSLEVRSDCSLKALHHVLQTAYGWEEVHLWQFDAGRKRIDAMAAAAVTLMSVAPKTGDRLVYTYDFGDSWEHLILVEEFAQAAEGVQYPRCTGGQYAAPPEDCGGIWGYAELCEILSDPDHPEHEERLEWLGLDSADEFDSVAFEATLVDHGLRGLMRLHQEFAKRAATTR